MRLLGPIENLKGGVVRELLSPACPPGAPAPSASPVGGHTFALPPLLRIARKQSSKAATKAGCGLAAPLSISETLALAR